MIVIIVLLAVFCASMLVVIPAENVYAAREIEWGSYQNSADNNGVTDRDTPAAYNEAALKWGKQLVRGYTTSFTPPLIVGGYIYTASKEKVYRL